MIYHRINKIILPLLIVLLTLPTLWSCGKKTSVTPPPGGKSDFPHKYPSY